jgi:hypothetical protein
MRDQMHKLLAKHKKTGLSSHLAISSDVALLIGRCQEGSSI